MESLATSQEILNEGEASKLVLLCDRVKNGKVARTQVAIIESSDSEDEQGDSKMSLVVDEEAKSTSEMAGDGNSDVELSLKVDKIQIKSTHVGEIPEAVEQPLYSGRSRCVRRIDFKTWVQSKHEQKASQSKQLQHSSSDSSKEAVEVRDPEIDSLKQMAWVNWMCKKKIRERRRKKQELELMRLEAEAQEEKRRIAQEMFENWYKKKQQELDVKKVVTQGTSKEKRNVQLSRLVKFEDWYEKKKSQAIPKNFTHVNYPKPTWVNPEPWQNPDTPTDTN